MAILQDMTQVEMLSLEAQIAALRAENNRLKARTTGKLSLRVSAKGAVSVYGMGRWPVTLYRSQWETLLSQAQAIKDFIADNADSLSVKGEE